MRILGKYLFMWGIGGTLYYSFELLFRGFSHWTMFILGGICFLFIYIQGKIVKYNDSVTLQLIRSIIFITCMEFITGIIVNKWLHLKIWDYSTLPFHIFGQICLPFMIIFSGLSSLSIILCGYIGYWFLGEEKPHFHIL